MSVPHPGTSLREATRTLILIVAQHTSVIRRARTGSLATAPWILALLERRPARVVTVAMANKTARIVWAVLARGEAYRAPATA